MGLLIFFSSFVIPAGLATAQTEGRAIKCFHIGSTHTISRRDELRQQTAQQCFFDWARHRCLQRGRGTNKKNNRRNFGCWRKGDLGGVRPHDPQLRRLLLYPTELRDHHKKQPTADKLYSKIHSMAFAVQKYIKYIELQNI